MKFTTILIITLISITSCGYTVVSQKDFDKYKIENLIISGDKRIAYLLRNKLKSKNKNTSKIINLDLSSNKVKNIKEKNIQNNVNKYEIIITIIVNFEILILISLANLQSKKKETIMLVEGMASP